MKVREMIAMLRDCPPDADLWFAGHAGMTAYAVDKELCDDQCTVLSFPGGPLDQLTPSRAARAPQFAMASVPRRV